MKKNVVSYWIMLGILAAAIPSPLLAQEAPPPRSMPRVPVSREALQHNAASGPRMIQGTAVVIDGEKLRLGDTELRLFGVVPPQLAASFGPQARAELDALTSGQVTTCQIRDRDRDFRLLATCQVGNNDLALELLKRGLAVSARGSLAGSDLLPSYIAAEESAQAQKVGLWSISVSTTTPSASAPSHAEPPAVTTQPAVTPAVAAPQPPTQVVVARDEKITPRTDKASIPSSTSTPSKIAAELEEEHTQAHYDDERWSMASSQVGFFERYQILISGILMLTTALSIIAAVWMQKSRDKRDEIKAIAAALRGELMAARGVCIGRIKNITTPADDQASAWPRIRATLYGAYVGRLGLLGAELARQISSVYGQASDYAALYNPNTTSLDTPKKQALETLVRHIDEVLPKLNVLEQSGKLTALAERGYAPSYTYTNSAPTYRPVQTSAHHTAQVQRPVTAQATAQAAPRVPADLEEESMVVTEEYIEIARAPMTASSGPTRSPLALWESVRGFIQNHRQVIDSMPQEAVDYGTDPEVSEYAAMIEADMARYRRQEQAQSLHMTDKPTRSRTG